eukprot:TRINITY_DN30357_c0_g1_i1.p1 TRINITY_DN30357_c0_g1~~TRINITY_DN30357_c0_g1_i1.p1  ORF type:complete len:476 (+),score=161.33 TRINITY_DN30357_c0_g1_i1:76-1428(+)
MVAPEGNKALARYCRVVDEIVRDVQENGVLGADDDRWKKYLETVPPERRFLEGSKRRVKHAVQQALVDERCMHCWVLREVCYCAELPEVPTRVNFAVLYHPNEYLRSTSTGKLVSQVLGGEMVVYGCHEERVNQLVDDPNTYILFPHETAVTLRDICGARPAVADAPSSASTTLPSAQGEAKAQDAPPAPLNTDALKAVTVVVLDGTWRQARTLFSLLEKRNPNIKRLRLDLAHAGAHQSLFNALRKQSEAGRVSTFEACMLLLSEAAEDTTALEGVMKQMVSFLTFEKHTKSPFAEVAVSAERKELSIAGQKRRTEACSGVPRLEKKAVKNSTDVELETWIEKLKNAAERLPLPPPVVRRCRHCELFLTPARLHEHLRGRLHAQTVAKDFLGRPKGRGKQCMGPEGNHARAKLITDAQADAVAAAVMATLHVDHDYRTLLPELTPPGSE